MSPTSSRDTVPVLVVGDEPPAGPEPPPAPPVDPFVERIAEALYEGDPARPVRGPAPGWRGRSTWVRARYRALALAALQALEATSDPAGAAP